MNSRHDVLPPHEMEQLKTGDIIMRRGFGLMSTMIADALDENPEVSHCGIIVKINHNFYVVHSISKALSQTDGVRYDMLGSFIKQSKPNSVVVTRYKSLTPSMIKRLKDKTLYYLEKKIPFDHAFDLHDSTKFYCNELVRNIILHATGTDVYKQIPEGTDRHVRFEVFYNPEYFGVIINHNP